MHGSVLDFLRATLLPEDVRGKRILEVGSCDVNGTPRSVIVPLEPALYVGVDQGPGPSVDSVVDAAKLTDAFGTEAFDVVISTEMYEHLADWRPVVSEMKRVLRPGGLIIVTTRSPGFPYHAFPIDAWRYTGDDMKRIFSDMKILALVHDPQHPGIFMKARKPAAFEENDLSGIELAPAPGPS